MAEFAYTLKAAPVLTGTDLSFGDNRVVVRDELALVSVAVPLGGDEALTKAMQQGWALSLPSPTLSQAQEGVRLLRSGPDQLLMLFAHATPDAAQVVANRLGDAGYVTDQTDAWVVLDLSGPQTLAALERLCPLDTAQMPEDGAARTVMEHMGAFVIRLAPDRFLLMSAASSAGSFLHAVGTSYRYVVPGKADV